MKTPRRRRDLPFDVVPTDRQLWAIGLVVTQWSSLELMIQILGHALTEKDSPERTEFDSSLRFKRRLRQLRILVETRIMEPWNSEILHVLTEIGSIQNERDKIVHHSFGQSENQLETPNRVTLDDYRPGRVNYGWKLDYNTIRNVAIKIADLNQKLFEIPLRAAGRPKSFLLGDALRRITRSQSKNP